MPYSTIFLRFAEGVGVTCILDEWQLIPHYLVGTDYFEPCLPAIEKSVIIIVIYAVCKVRTRTTQIFGGV